MRPIGIALCSALLAAASGCMSAREVAGRVTCPFVPEGVHAGILQRGRATAKDGKSACPLAGRRSTERKCPRKSAATSLCPRDYQGAGKGTCPFVAHAEISRGSSSGAQTMEF